MPDAPVHDDYKPIYIIEVYLDSGPLIVSTRDVEIIIETSQPEE